MTYSSFCSATALDSLIRFGEYEDDKVIIRHLKFIKRKEMNNNAPEGLPISPKMGAPKQ